MAATSRTPTTSLQNWDFNTKHVQQNLVGGDFVGSHSTIICATAPRLADLASDALENVITDASAVHDLDQTIAIPIGVIDSSAIQQDRQLAQIFEIGSKRSYIMSARTATQMSINRVIYKGANLLRMFYSYYPDQAAGSVINETMGNILRDNQKNSNTSMGGQPIGLHADLLRTLPKDIKDTPGYNNFWLNLNSDIFSQPYGLILFMKDNNQSDVAAVFLEECYIQNHGFQISANSVVMAETTSIRCERIVPIKVKVESYNESTSTSSSASEPGIIDRAADFLGLGGLLG